MWRRWWQGRNAIALTMSSATEAEQLRPRARRRCVGSMICWRNWAHGRGMGQGEVERGRWSDFPAKSRRCWIAATDAGLVLAILNMKRQRQRTAGRVSRGAIIPALLHVENIKRAVDCAQRIPPGDFEPFRLVLLDRCCVSEIVWDGQVFK